MADDGTDPYELLAQRCVISDSQEELLRSCSFAGNPNSAVAVGGGSASSDPRFLPPHPFGVPATSLERSEQRKQLSPNHAFQPPPEQSVGDAVEVEDGCERDAATVVGLGKNPHLGFPSEVQSQQNEAEIIGGVRIGESESAPVVVNLDSGGSSGDETLCVKKKRTSGNVDASRENEDNESVNMSLLEILKFVAEKEKEGSMEDLGDKSILEIVSDRGMTFPRPRWWPEDFEFK